MPKGQQSSRAVLLRHTGVFFLLLRILFFHHSTPKTLHIHTNSIFKPCVFLEKTLGSPCLWAVSVFGYDYLRCRVLTLLLSVISLCKGK